MTTSVLVTVNDRQKEIPIAVDFPSDLSKFNQDAVGVLLTHGAGGDLSSGNLPFYAKIFADAGFPCCRFTCRGPLPHRVAVAKALLLAPPIPSLPKVTQWIVAGHSMGARVAAQVAADLPNLIKACIFFSYPLHPPGESDKLRDDPLTSLTLPLLFIRGTKDPFCEEKPWKEVTKRLQSGQMQVHGVEGAGHGLEKLQSRGGKKEKNEDKGENSTALESAVKEFCLQAVSKSSPKKQSKKKAPSSGPPRKRKQQATPAAAASSARKRKRPVERK